MAQIERGTITPDDLVALQKVWPCTECLTDSQLWMVMFIAMNFLYNQQNGTSVTPTERLQQFGCLNCLSDKQVLQGVASKLITITSQLGYNAQAGLEDASCLQCADPKAVRTGLAAMLSGIIGVQIIL